MERVVTPWIWALALALAAGPAQGQEPRTTAEASGFERYTTHDEMMAYLLRLRASSTDMRLGVYGESWEGRELPYAIFSRPLVSQPEEAALLGRPVLLLAANVHGGERTLRESLLILMRELATPGTPANALLDDLVIIAAPQLNPDGFHAGEQGQRGNAWGIDLNRDYVKLEQPEIQSFVGNLFNAWRPHVFVDGHDGGAYPYDINYQCPSHASSDPRITELCDFEIFPFVEHALAAEDFKSWFYQSGTETRWNAGDFQPRIARNYAGLVNTVGILFESPGGDAKGAVRAGYLSYRAVLDFAQQRPERVMEVVRQARAETLALGQGPAGDVVVRMEYGPEERTVSYEIPRGSDGETLRVTSDSLMKKPVPLVTRPRPYAYVLPRDAEDAVALLLRHGITVERLRTPASLPVQAYTIAAVGYTQQYNHAAAVELTVGEVLSQTVDFPVGTYVVPTGQLLGRLVCHMLEPETDDNVIYWNTMDAWLPRPQPALRPPADVTFQLDPGGASEPPLVPIYKLMARLALPTVVVPTPPTRGEGSAGPN